MTDTRQPLTSTTWADLSADRSYLSRDYAQTARLYWPQLSDLGHELATIHPHLGRTDPRIAGPADILVDLCVSQIPVILTWTDGPDTTTAAVIVEYLGTAHMHVRYCGFGHDVYLANVTDAQPFETVRTFG